MEINDIMDYSSHNREVFNELLDRCKSGYAVPYIGAGLSVFAGLPSWHKLLSGMREECQDRGFSLSNPLSAADEIERQLGHEYLMESLQQTFNYSEDNSWWEGKIKEKQVEDQAISIIPHLFHGPIITSNYEKIIEAVHHFDIPVALPENIDILKDTNQEIKHVLYKVHGSISDPESIIFTGKSYSKYYHQGSNHVQVLSTYFKRFNLLFLGCSLSLTENKDKPIELWETLVHSGQHHFAILPCERNECQKRYEELQKINIYPILYPQSEHLCVKTILNCLLFAKQASNGIPQYDANRYPFVAREKLLAMIKDELDHSVNGNIVILNGSGGVGKTRTACEYARREEKEYYNGTYIFHAVSYENIYAEIFQFLLTKGLIDESNVGQYEKKEVISTMSKWMNRNNNWLFILDNVENMNHISVFMNMHYGQSSSGKRHIIVTTRCQKTIKPCIHVRPFTIKDSESVLCAITHEEPNSYSKILSRLLGGLPLALEQAASYIVNSKISYRECLSDLQSNGILDVLTKGRHSNETLAVAATYNLSLEKIRTEGAKQLMQILSCFASENIDYYWILNYAHKVVQDPCLQEIMGNPQNIRQMVDELVSYSLVYEHSGKLNVHRITQDVVRKGDTDKEWLRTSCKIMSTAFNNIIVDGANYKRDFLNTVPHMQQMFKLCDNSSIEVDVKSLGMLYHLYMFGFHQIQEFKQAIHYLKNTIRYRKEAGDILELAKTYNVIGNVYQELGDLKTALYYHRKTLEIRLEAFNEPGTLLARTFNNIGLNYYWSHEYENAEKYLYQAITIKKMYDNPFELAYSYSNLGASYETSSLYLNNKALSYNRQAYDIRKKSKNLVRIAFSLNNLGVAEMNGGNYNDAIMYLEKALELRKQVYAKDTLNRDIGEVHINLGEIFTRLGKFPQAKEHIDKAIYIFEKRLPRGHEYTTNAYDKLARWYYAQHMYDEALKVFKKIKRILKRKLIAEDFYLSETIRMIENCNMWLRGGTIL